MTLQELSFTEEYIAGDKNQLANALTRIPWPSAIYTMPDSEDEPLSNVLQSNSACIND